METIYSFGYWVRRRRKALDLTQRQLAERVGCAVVTLKKIEADDRRPSLQMAERLADMLQIPAADRTAFLEAARGLRPVDTLPQSPRAGQPAPRDVIPSTAASLVGRESELATVLSLLEATDTRLVTLVGPGGIGKTRLSLAVARALQQRDPRPFRQGIVFVDLSAITTADGLPAALASAMGLSLDSRGQDPRSPEAQLTDYLRRRDTLFVLDNVEQVSGFSPLLGDLLRETTAMRFLVTSRERVGLTWEHAIQLHGLPYPTGAAVDPQGYPAGQLFVDRAGRVRPGYAPGKADWGAVAQVCALVDGLPLALEMSAAWMDTLSAAEIAGELQQDLDLLAGDLADRPDRHRSVRAVWDSTWQRLSAAEQDVFPRLCVFQGGFTRAAAEAVSGVTLPELAALGSHCLITYDTDNGRYRIHELLRQYGLEQLAAAGLVEETRDRHLMAFVQWVTQAEPALHGPEQPAWLAQFDCEQDNLRLALGWGLARPENAGRFVQLALPLHWYWRIRSHVREGRDWAERALVQSGRSAADEATLQFVAGHMAWMSGDFALARQRQMASLAYWQTSNRPVSPAAAHVHVALGLTALHQGYPAESIEWHQAGLAMFRELGDRWGEAFTLGQLGFSLHRAGDQDAARQVIDESLALSRALGDPFLLALFLHHAAINAQDTGDRPRATALAEEAAAYERTTGHTHSLGQTLMMLGRLAQQRGDAAAAVAYWQEALDLLTDIGHATYAAEAAQLLSGAIAPPSAAPNPPNLL